MFRIQAPILIVPTAEAREALGIHLRPAALAAYREIALAAKGLEIAHLQFAFGELTLAVCSRVRRDGIVEIEIGLGDPRLPKSSSPPRRCGRPRPPPVRAAVVDVADDIDVLARRRKNPTSHRQHQAFSSRRPLVARARGAARRTRAAPRPPACGDASASDAQAAHYFLIQDRETVR